MANNLREVDYTVAQSNLLKGKAISHVRIMSDMEMTDYDFNFRPTVIVFTDGSELFPVNGTIVSDGGIFVYAPE